uniref:Uncharacterized protein n=1 Tax=Mustela putorius furo TaxID=9669 RepID=M3Z089_MUSPF
MYSTLITCVTYLIQTHLRSWKRCAYMCIYVRVRREGGGKERGCEEQRCPAYKQEIIYPFFFNEDFIYLFDREREREQAQVGRAAEGKGEAGSPLSREPEARLDPRILGS